MSEVDDYADEQRPSRAGEVALVVLWAFAALEMGLIFAYRIWNGPTNIGELRCP